MPIHQLAREEVIHAPPVTPLQDIAGLMRDNRVGSVIITDDDRPVGIITDRDLAIKAMADGADPQDHVAGDIMSAEVCTVDESTGFYESAETMREHGIRRLPICNDAGELTGIITADDLTELLADEMQQIAGVIQSQRQPY